MKKNYLLVFLSLLGVFKLDAQRVNVTSNINYPVGLLLIDDELYISSQFGPIYKMDINASIPTTPPAVNTQLTNAYDMVFYDSNIYVSDYTNNAINKIDITSTPLLASNVIQNTSLTPYGIAVYNNYLYYTSLSEGKILKLDLTLPNPVEIEVLTGLVGPFDIAIKDNTLYFTQQNNNKLSKIDLANPIPTVVDVMTNIVAPIGLIFHGDNLFINSLAHDTITQINITDNPIVKTVFDVGSTFNSAEMLIHNNDLYLAEYSNHRVSKINMLPTVSIAGHGGCHGEVNGTATAEISKGFSPFTYLWSNGATTPSIHNLSPGEYSVTITDVKGHTATDTIVLTEPTALTSSIQVDSNLTCFGDSNAGITVIASGGVAPYTYAWNNLANTASITGLAAGTYSVTITDANGCTTSNTASIITPTAPSNSTQHVNAIGSYEWIDGNTYTESTYGPTFTYTNVNGFDSVIVTLNLNLINYCSSRSTRNRFEWIKQVELGIDINNLSNRDVNGYGDYTDQLLSVDTGDVVTVSLTPGYRRRAYVEYWRIWADWNLDGDFNDPNEKVFEAKGKNTITGSFTIPVDVDPNELGLRVSMRWKSYAPSCGNFRNGEVEDYRIIVNGAQGSPYSEQQGKLANETEDNFEDLYEFAEILPNPVTQGEVISGYLRTEESGEKQIYILNPLGQVIKSVSIVCEDQESYFEIPTSDLTPGLYFLNVNRGNETQKIIVR